MKRSYSLLVLLILLVFAWSSSFAANEIFRVLAAKGETMVQRDGKGSWSKLITGNQLFGKDNIKINNGAYLGLVHSKGRTLELKKAGTYSASELAKEIVNKNTKVSEKLANYVMSQVGASKDIIGDNDYRKNMSTTGAVERSIQTDALNQGSKIYANCPKRISVIGTEVNFSWSKAKDGNEYEYILTDRFDRPEFTKIIKDTIITINAKELKLNKDEYYFWKVRLTSNPDIKSDEICFSFLSDKKSNSIKDTVRLLKEDVGDDNAPAKVLLAGFYEQNYLIKEADKAYNEAIKLAPDVEEYQNMYKEFLMRTNYFSLK
jgi:hypothetical protein